MKPFHTVAVPHRDILEGRLSLDVYAADLWELHQRRAPKEYADRETFFRRTHLTRGLQHLVDEVERRLRGEGGDPVIQLQTPFGGGKTHALIALHHQAKAWGANPVVLVGDALPGSTTLWGVLEEQLMGASTRLTSPTAPGREALRAVLEPHQPLLILADELLEYVTKAAGVQVGESTMAAQTMAFMQELTETVASLPRACLVVTLPSSLLEHYDASAERLFQQLQKVVGRVERVLTPVAEDEVASVIRRRLFEHVDEREAAAVVDTYLEYAEREGLLPPGTEPVDYRRRFLASYPFLPEVIDILYHRWGSLPAFQRTRGVLRILALVIYQLRESAVPYVTLADFDLTMADLRRELLKYAGNEYDSVLAADITGPDAGSRKADADLGAAYRGLRLSTRAAVTVFMHSFSGGSERGAHIGEIKRHAAVLGTPSAAVVDAVERLRDPLKGLHYLWKEGDRYVFRTEANLTRVLLQRMETLAVHELPLEQAERKLLEDALSPQRTVFERRTYVWPDSEVPANVPDVPVLTLVVLRRKDEDLMQRIVEQKGAAPRVHRNALVFLYPLEGERMSFRQELLRYLACQDIHAGASRGAVKLSDDQRNELKTELENLKASLSRKVRMLYRLVAVPARDGFREIDLGVPTVGDERGIAAVVYDRLRAEQEIVETIAPTVIQAKYLRGREHVSTAAIYNAALRTPGEPRWANPEVLRRGIAEGVKQGFFGLGDVVGGVIQVRAFRTAAEPTLSEGEVLVPRSIAEAGVREVGPPVSPGPAGGEGERPGGTEEDTPPGGVSPPSEPVIDHLNLTLGVPLGSVSALLGILNFLQKRFGRIVVEVRCQEGRMTQSEYEQRLMEAIRQGGLELHHECSIDRS